MAIDISSRQLFFLVAISIAAIISITLYMEHGLGLVPCNLCLLQRATFMAVGVIALISAAHNKASKAYAGLMLISAAFGALLSGRQLWLQSLPEHRMPTCGPDLGSLLDVFPLGEVISQVFSGRGQCAQEVVWQMAGLSIPGWSFIAFSGVIVITAAISWLGDFPRINTKRAG